jgi:hypothetical protein
MADAPESTVVTAVGVLIMGSGSDDLNARLEKAQSDAILQCAEEGITTEEKNSWIIRERMAEARQRVFDEEAAKAQ